MSPRRVRSPLFAVLAALLACLPASVLALEEDRLQEILIQGDFVKFDEQMGEITYEGNVSLVQGSLRLSAHLLIAKREAGEVMRITARRADSNQQVSYSQLIRIGEPEVTARADEMVYDLKKQIIDLDGNANLRQDEVEFSGNTIRYDIARGDTQAAGGVQMRLPPRFLENLENGGKAQEPGQETPADEPGPDSP